MYDFHSQKAYVSADGSWSSCEDTITFYPDALTEKQWYIVDALPDYTKMEYVIAVLDGDDEFVKEIESEYE